MKILTTLFNLFIICSLINCSTRTELKSKIPYPDPQPDSVAHPFLPGIVSRPDSLDFNAAFSPDGKLFYFARSENGKYNIYVTAFDGMAWGNASLAPFSEPEFSEADPFILPDGSLYLISDRPKDARDSIRDFDIWVIRPGEEHGSWGAPENLEAVNSDSTEYYVSLAANGNLYFASNRPGGYGSHDIYVSKFVNGKYTTPENLGPGINSAEMEHDPLISKDEGYIIFTSLNREGGLGEADLYYSVRENVDQPWPVSLNLGKQFNTPTYEYCPYLTPDSEFFFYSSDYDVKWISTKSLPFKVD